ncbi:helix-turn-helix domain-containing protein [Streptomyces niveus]|uniref:helix-turn-helix domain-containing protein n=1 Tax=Streptomyces niveus TaxID=193462 RepID=UPI0036281F3F
MKPTTTQAVRGADGKLYRPRLKGAVRRRTVRKLTRWYDRGSSIRDLVSEFNVPLGTVRLYLHEGGANIRPRGDTRRPTPY